MNQSILNLKALNKQPNSQKSLICCNLQASIPLQMLIRLNEIEVNLVYASLDFLRYSQNELINQFVPYIRPLTLQHLLSEDVCQMQISSLI